MQTLKKIDYNNRNNLNTVLYGNSDSNTSGSGVKEEVSLACVRSVKYNNIVSYILYGLSIYDQKGIPMINMESSVVDSNSSGNASTNSNSSTNTSSSSNTALNASLEKYNAEEVCNHINI